MTWDMPGYLIVDDTPDAVAAAIRAMGQWSQTEVELTEDDVQALLSGKVLVVETGQNEYCAIVRVRSMAASAEREAGAGER